MGRQEDDTAPRALREDAAGTDPTGAEALVRELSDLARARNRLELATSRFPTLIDHAAEPSIDSIFATIDEATQQLDQARRQAASCLLADTPERWTQNLKTRSTAAAGHLGIGSYHTFRDRRNGPSPSDELLMAVATQLVGAGSTVRENLATPSDAARSDSSPTGIAAGPSRDPRRWLVLAGVVVAIAVVALASRSSDDVSALDGTDPATATASTDAAATDTPATDTPATETAAADAAASDSAATSGDTMTSRDSETFADGTVGASEAIPVDGCDIPLGGSVTPTPDQAAVALAIAGAVDDVGGVEATGCPLHSIERWQSLWVQAFVGAELPPGSVLTDDTGQAFWVEEGVLTGYRSGMSGTLQFVSGLPVGFRTEDGAQILELADGAVVVAEVPGNRAFWIAAEASDDWLAAGGAAGGLGPPMTDPNFIDGRPEQHYRNGRIWEGEPGEAIVEIVDPADVAAYLEPFGQTSERLVRSFDSTAWWIDRDGVRRWIPDGETWNCVGGADVVLEEESPGWVIGSFPIGPPMSCDELD